MEFKAKPDYREKKHENINIFVSPVRTIVFLEKGSKGTVLFLSESKKLDSVIKFQMYLDDLNDWQVKEIYKLPHSKKVQLFNQKTKYNKVIIVQETTNPSLYNLLGRFSFGAYINGREQRYRNLYLVYEALSKEKDETLESVRHAISHPNLSNPKTQKIVKRIFGSEIINLKKQKQNMAFRSICCELKFQVRSLLIKEIENKLKKTNNKINDLVPVI